jgi:hypothetical protein
MISQWDSHFWLSAVRQITWTYNQKKLLKHSQPRTLSLVNSFTLKLALHDLHLNVTGPVIGCTIPDPVRRASNKFAFNPKYHFAGRSASSISINFGSCFNPSACLIIVSWSCRKNVFPNIRNKNTGKNGKFQAATKSIRHKSRLTGVTVARLENHILPL